MINAQLTGLARTSTFTLRARADEQSQDNPIIQDDWSKNWYEFVPHYEDFNQWYNPTFQLTTVIRSQIIDDYVQQMLDAIDNPVVVELGAGFSTRYFRIGQEKGKWIELDVEDIIVVRRKLDLEVTGHWFVSGDIADDNWTEQIPETDPENIIFVAEHSLMFAEEDTVADVIKLLRDKFSGATLIMDIANPEYAARVSDDFKSLKAPIQWVPTESDLAKYELDVQDTTNIATQYAERWDALTDTTDVLDDKDCGVVVRARLD